MVPYDPLCSMGVFYIEFDTVFSACGSSNSAIELTPDEMEKYSAAVSWIDVCKGWNQSD